MPRCGARTCPGISTPAPIFPVCWRPGRSAPRPLERLLVRNAGVRWLWPQPDRGCAGDFRGRPLRSDAHVLLSLLAAYAAVRADGRYPAAAAGPALPAPFRRTRPTCPAAACARARARHRHPRRRRAEPESAGTRRRAGAGRSRGPAAELHPVPAAPGIHGAAALRSASRRHLRGYPRQRPLDHAARRGPGAGIGHRPGGPHTRWCSTMRTCTAACSASTTACAIP